MGKPLGASDHLIRKYNNNTHGIWYYLTLRTQTCMNPRVSHAFTFNFQYHDLSCIISIEHSLSLGALARGSRRVDQSRVDGNHEVCIGRWIRRCLTRQFWAHLRLFGNSSATWSSHRRFNHHHGDFGLIRSYDIDLDSNPTSTSI